MRSIISTMRRQASSPSEPDGSIAYLNATLAGWLGYDLAQFAADQLTLSDIFAGEGASLLSVVSGRPGEVTTEHFDVDLKPRQGRVKPVRLLHRVAFSSEGLPGPSRTLVLEAASAETGDGDGGAAELRFARIFNSTPMAIVSIDANGFVLRSNGAFAKMAPAALKPAAGESRPSIYRGVAERDHPALRAAILAACEGKGDIEPVDLALDDGSRSARFFISAADPAGGEGASAIIFALDTTEQRTLEENFAQSQKMQAIGQLAGGIAHDFNNVLTAIIGYSDLLLANHRPTDPSFQDIMQIKQNANRAAGLVRQLLAFSRRQTLRPQTLQLSDVLSDLQMLLRRLVGETIELEVVYGRDLWLVKADLNQFEQVIVNLVVNARDAMSEGGHITLRTRNVTSAECAAFNEKALPPAEYVLVEVQDTGHGIPDDVRDKIFEPFFTTKEVGKGTGLGLSMVYGIVKQTGGFVFCESAPGAGATFRILLPRYIPELTVEPVKKEVPKPTADLTGQGAILLVEDEEAVRAFAARALASRGYTVLEAESGVDALRVVEQAGGKIDLIVSDVIMPEMDGPTMLTELRKRGLTGENHIRFRLRRRCVRQESARRPGISFPAQAFHAQAVDRDRKRRDGLSGPSGPRARRARSPLLIRLRRGQHAFSGHRDLYRERRTQDRRKRRRRARAPAADQGRTGNRQDAARAGDRGLAGRSADCLAHQVDHPRATGSLRIRRRLATARLPARRRQRSPTSAITSGAGSSGRLSPPPSAQCC